MVSTWSNSEGFPLLPRRRRGSVLRRALKNLEEVVGGGVCVMRRELDPGIWYPLGSSPSWDHVLRRLVLEEEYLTRSLSIEQLYRSPRSTAEITTQGQQAPLKGKWFGMRLSPKGREYVLVSEVPLQDLVDAEERQALLEMISEVEDALSSFELKAMNTTSSLLLRAISSTLPRLGVRELSDVDWVRWCLRQMERLSRGTMAVATLRPTTDSAYSVLTTQERGLYRRILEVLAASDATMDSLSSFAEIIGDIDDSDTTWLGGLKRALGLPRGTSLIIVPLVGEGYGRFGTLILVGRSRYRFDSEDLDHATAFAEVISSGILLRRSESRALSESNYHRYLARALDQAAEGIVIVDPSGRPLYGNASFSQLSGFGDVELMDVHASALFSSDEDDPDHSAGSWSHGHHQPRRMLCHRKDGTTFPADVLTAMLNQEDGTPEAYMVTVVDATRSSAAMANLRTLAQQDPLTSLFNRRALIDYLEKLLCASEGSEKIGVVFIDIDRFKSINDTFGHRAGDELLQIVAARLRGVLRDHDLAGRIGGDEFLVILDDVDSKASAQRIADRIAKALYAEPVTVMGHKIRFAASLGVALSDRVSTTPDQLINLADQTMYRSKRSARAVAISGGEIAPGSLSVTDHELAETLVHALQRPSRSGLTLQYSPIVDIRTNRVTQIGAVMVFDDPVLGIFDWKRIEKVAFMTRQAERLMRWLVERASSDVLGWLDRDPSMMMGRNLAIDIFAPILFDRGLLTKVAAMIRDKCLSDYSVMIEVAESSLSQGDLGEVVSAIRYLANNDMVIAIDDFATIAPLQAVLSAKPTLVKVSPRSPYEGWYGDVDQIEMFAQVAASFHAEIIAKRVDSRADLALLEDYVRFIQPSARYRYAPQEVPDIIRLIESGVLPWLGESQS